MWVVNLSLDVLGGGGSIWRKSAWEDIGDDFGGDEGTSWMDEVTSSAGAGDEDCGDVEGG